MGWISNLLSRFRRRYTPVELIASATGWVEIVGTIEALEVLHCPLTGDDAVAIYYRAVAPGATSRSYAGLLGDAFHITSQGRQALDFLLRDDSGAALIRMDRGPDVAGIHAQLSQRHGLELTADTELLRPGQHVRVRGYVTEQSAATSPHRRGPYAVVLDADEVSIIE
ncbi:MAG: hypothetical protein ACPG4T_02965 [Nannocystaceae bacterium]